MGISPAVLSFCSSERWMNKPISVGEIHIFPFFQAVREAVGLYDQRVKHPAEVSDTRRPTL